MDDQSCIPTAVAAAPAVAGYASKEMTPQEDSGNESEGEEDGMTLGADF